jgi:hypothetical protein
MRLDRWSLAWSIGFGLLFAAALSIRALDAPQVARLAFAGFLLGTYCMFFALSSHAKRSKRPPLTLQVALGGALGVVLVLLLGGSGDLIVPGAIIGVVLGLFADVWARHISLP